MHLQNEKLFRKLNRKLSYAKTSEMKTLKEYYRMQYMQIRYKILEVKDIYEKVLKEVTCDLPKC